MFLGLGGVSGHQVGLPDVFVHAAVPRVYLQRALVVLEGDVDLTVIAMREPEEIVNIGVVGGALISLGKRLDRGLPVSGLDCPPALRKIRISFGQDCLLYTSDAADEL